MKQKNSSQSNIQFLKTDENLLSKPTEVAEALNSVNVPLHKRTWWPSQT